MVDTRRFRTLMGHYPTGVVAVTAMDDDEPAGMAVNSFTSLSLEPTLVMFGIARTSTTWPRLRRVGAVCINVLGSGQDEVCRKFAVRGADRFAGVSWTPSPRGLPVLDDCVAWLECRLRDELDGGDHVIVTAEVDYMEYGRAGAPLVFHRGQYGGLGRWNGNGSVLG